MNREEISFLETLGKGPARLTKEQAAVFLNCEEHDIPVLVAEGMLKPLGRPEQNSVKYFATVSLLEKLDDEDWLHKMTKTLAEFWKKKNAKRKVAKECGKADILAFRPPESKDATPLASGQ